MVHMGRLTVKNIDSMFRELKNTKAIIFDLRQYPKGTLFMLAKYLFREPAQFASIIYPDLNYPGHFLWDDRPVVGPKPNENFTYYEGKVIVLVSEYSQSQSEWTAMALQARKGTITIGSTTSGADGDVSFISLPGGYSTMMSGLGVFYPDRTPTQQVGVKIDVVVKPTIKGIREGRDEVLEKALSLLNN